MFRRRLPLTAIISSTLVAGGLFMLDFPKSQENQSQTYSVKYSAPITVTETSESNVKVVASAQAAVTNTSPLKQKTFSTASYNKHLVVGKGDSSRPTYSTKEPP